MKYSNSPLLWCVLKGQEDGGFARAGLKLFPAKAWLTKQPGPTV